MRLIDASEDVTPYVDQLRDAGIVSIGRYYGRPAPANGCLYPGKLLTARELRAIEGAGLSVFTVFQHCAGTCSAFRESYRKGIEDASAAIHSAHLLGQPAGSPIYFAVDFNPVPSTDKSPNAKCEMRVEEDIMHIITEYFWQVNRIVRKAGWKVGVYGAGATCAHLKAIVLDGIPLAEFFWLSASVGHRGHADFFRGGQWHLFQNKIDLTGIGYLGEALEVDTDVTNPDRPYFGQWRTDTPPDRMPGVEPQNARAILARRAFVKGKPAIYRQRAADGLLRDPYPEKFDIKGRTVRVIEEFPARGGNPETVAVDLFESEKVTGYLYRDALALGLQNGIPG